MSDTTRDDEPSPTKRPLVHPMLIKATIASAALHLLPLTGLLNVHWSDTTGFSADWEGTFGDLSGVGQGGDSGRWAKLDAAPPKPKEAEKPRSPEKEEKPEETAEKPPEPEKKPEKKPEKPKKKKKKAVAKKPEKKPKNAVEDEKTPKKKPVEVAKVEKTEETGGDEAAAEATTPPAEPRDPNDLAGLRREGPTGLPDMRAYAPGNARMTALFRLDRLRGTSLDKPIARTLGAVPDFHILMHSTGVVPLRDIDSVFASSADPRYIQETFWALRHHVDNTILKRALGRRYAQPIPWTTYKGMPMRDIVPDGISYRDPRKVVLAEEGLALVTKPNWLPRLTRKLSDESALRHPGDPDAPTTMLDGLARIERAAEDSDAFAMISFNRRSFTIPGHGNVRLKTLRASLSDPSKPRLDADLEFYDAASAAKLARSCPTITKDLSRSFLVMPLGLSAHVSRLSCSHEPSSNFVNVTATYTPAEIIKILGVVQTFSPEPLAVDALPAVPQKKSAPTKPKETPATKADPTKVDPAKTPPNTSPQELPVKRAVPLSVSPTKKPDTVLKKPSKSENKKAPEKTPSTGPPKKDETTP